MEISKLSENGIKIKAKTVSIGIDATSSKGQTDVAILLKGSLTKAGFLNDGSQLIINGPGEYEIKGVKLTGYGKENEILYAGRIDNIRVCITKASSLSKVKDMLEDCDILILETDVIPDQKLLVSFNPNVIVLYGQNSQEIAKQLGKELIPISKYSITKDKLPSELEVSILN